MTGSDEELVSRARDRDARAFDELVCRHQERVFALAYHILGSAEDAADVQQETFVRAWTSLPKFRGQAAFSTWLHKITVNGCLSRKRRKEWRGEVFDEDERIESAGSPLACQERVVNSLVVREVLASIPTRLRVVLVLKSVEGRSVEEVCEIVGYSNLTVKKQLWRARKLFRERLLQYSEEER